MQIELKKEKALGEVDYPDHVKVYFTDKTGHVERMWVKMISGNKKCGKGILDSEPLLLKAVKLGDIIHYRMLKETDLIPTYTKKAKEKNRRAELVKEVEINLKESMTWNPTVNRRW